MTDDYACTHCGSKKGTTLEVKNAEVTHQGVAVAVPVWVKRRCFGCGKVYAIDRLAHMKEGG